MAEVTLQLYTVGKYKAVRHVNKVSSLLPGPGKMGAFHAAVEVYGREWAFGLVEGEGTGVFWGTPTQCDMHQYERAVPLGTTALSEREVLALIERLKPAWPGAGYHFLRRNCVTFADALCRELGVGPVPTYVGRAAGGAAVVVDVVGTVTAAVGAGVGAVSRRATDFNERHQVGQTISTAAARATDAGIWVLGGLGSVFGSVSSSTCNPVTLSSAAPPPSTAAPPAAEAPGRSADT